MIIQQTRYFAQQKKKLHSNQIQKLDTAIKAILKNPAIGEQKKGDLRTTRVYKFRITSLEYLLAYQLPDESTILLIALGSHENFYRDVKRALR